MSSKSILRTEIAAAMLSDEEKILALAKEVRASFYTIKYQLKNENPKLCQAHYIAKIKDLLDIPVEEDIHTVKYDEETALDQ